MSTSVSKRLIHLVSSRLWLLVISVSLLLAGGSAWVLSSHLGQDPKDKVYALYDSVIRFTHETIRLTFRTDKKRAAVFVAPIGILNQKADFNWVKSYQDFNVRSIYEVEDPKAPARLLDADWRPVFQMTAVEGGPDHGL